MTLHFPERQSIIRYLENHPLTSEKTNPGSSNKKIIEAVATFFSNKDQTDLEVMIGMGATIYDLNEKSDPKLSKIELGVIKSDLLKALKDCGNGKKIELEEKTSLV